MTDVNEKQRGGRSILYYAARSGGNDFVGLLLSRQADLESLDPVSGWTPLISASVQGHIAVAEMLLGAGAKQDAYDFLGWTAKDLASYRDHMKLAKLLSSTGLNPSSPPSSNPLLSMVPAKSARETDYIKRQIAALKNISSKAPKISIAAQSTFTRDSVLKENQIILSFKSFESLMNHHPRLNYPITYPDTAFSVEISVQGATGTDIKLPLPLLEDMTYKPSIFNTSNLQDVTFVFNIFHDSADIRHPRAPYLIGSGVALLENLNQGLSPAKERLAKEYKLPIFSKHTLDLLGVIHFSLVVVSPLQHPGAAFPRIATNDLWNDNEPAKIVGHRGNLLFYPRACSMLTIFKEWVKTSQSANVFN